MPRSQRPAVQTARDGTGGASETDSSRPMARKAAAARGRPSTSRFQRGAVMAATYRAEFAPASCVLHVREPTFGQRLIPLQRGGHSMLGTVLVPLDGSGFA